MSFDSKRQRNTFAMMRFKCFRLLNGKNETNILMTISNVINKQKLWTKWTFYESPNCGDYCSYFNAQFWMIFRWHWNVQLFKCFVLFSDENQINILGSIFTLLTCYPIFHPIPIHRPYENSNEFKKDWYKSLTSIDGLMTKQYDW